MKLAFGPRFLGIAEEYRNSLPGKLAAMRDAALTGAHEVLATSAHRLAGASASLGALQASALCRELEDCCAGALVPHDWQERLQHIALACEQFCQRLDTA